MILDTKIVGKLTDQYVVCGGLNKVKHGLLFVTVTPCSVPCHLQENRLFSRAEKVQAVYGLAELEAPLSPDQLTETFSAPRLDEREIQQDYP